jgi:hypothetical protein
MRECGTSRALLAQRYKPTAAPATVSGEHLPEATDFCRKCDESGRRQAALTREPGDLPSDWSRAGRGASATVELISTVRGRRQPIRAGFRTPNTLTRSSG